MSLLLSIKSFSAGLVRGRVQDERDDQLLERKDDMDGADARVGQVLRSKWRLDALLGQGGMASVYAATHRNGRRGAVKILHPEMAAEPVVRARFLREGYLANKVDHAGAVAVLDDDQSEDGTVFVVMELLEGETVQARAEARPTRRLEVREVAFIADRLLDVLRSAHDKGIIHRDLKPENLFLTGSGQLKVLDFGIARVLQDTRSSISTKGGSVCGTPAFMPPEQARGLLDELDARTDLWAVGATMFALLAGREVHGAARTMNELLLAAMTEVARKLGSFVEVPSELALVVDRALEFDAAQRWPNARAMQLALRDAHFAAFGRPIHATLEDARRASFEGERGSVDRAPSAPPLATAAPVAPAPRARPASARASTSNRPPVRTAASARAVRNVLLLLAALATAGVAALLTRRVPVADDKRAGLRTLSSDAGTHGSQEHGKRAPEASKPRPPVATSRPTAAVRQAIRPETSAEGAPAAPIRMENKRRPRSKDSPTRGYQPPALER